MANTRPYTREELKGLRRANLQNLFKIHNLKGANGTNSILIDSLVEYFASPQYLSAHPSNNNDKDKSASAPLSRPHNTGRLEARYKNVPLSKPVKGRTVAAPIRKPVERQLSRSTQTGPKKPAPLPSDERIIPTTTSTEAVEQIQTSQQPTLVSSMSQNSLPTPPASSSSQSHPVSYSQVEALLSANDARWQAKLEALEKNLNDQMERLRIEMNQLGDQQQSQAGPSRLAGANPSEGRTWSPWQGQGRAASQPLSGSSNTHAHSNSKSPFPILGKRRNLDQRIDAAELEDPEKEAKRVRFNGSKPGDDTPLNEHPPTIFPFPTSHQQHQQIEPHTPSPQKTSAYGADYFANPSLTPLPAQSSLIPRTPSPSRQGVVPDNSQTPRLPNDWQDPVYPDAEADDSSLSAISDAESDTNMNFDDARKTPVGSISMIPQFSTTPEPPAARPISPTMGMGMERNVSGSSDRFAPGRLPSTEPEDRFGMSSNLRRDQTDAPPLSSVTDLERIEETDEQFQSQGQSHGQGQLSFPPIKPIRLSGLGTPSASASGTKGSTQRTPSLLGPPALISRTSRAGSELPRPMPRIRVGSRGLSPPTRPRSANAIHETATGGSSIPPTTTTTTIGNTFALNLPEPAEGMIERERLRSASADYMHVAMHGLEDDLDFDDSAATAVTSDINNKNHDRFKDSDVIIGLPIVEEEGEARVTGRSTSASTKTNTNTTRMEMPTPRHRTLLGTERYNDKRFGDIPVEFEFGMAPWESPSGLSRLPPTPM
ncbi:uncharacterized protein I303_103191 [Kwoniella dejecticola CBS 10117]|uniref:Uncharacterized protein n=1 Tax=Kwoniella dejecticola CBS 10117 TaxID=1296121 RepID=A0A1A6AAW5_9TREE|nr:uncharacterized protein I303_03214 [Kwoniella dejecticola CBS 10117]OBR87190.1 hypothetical protein I303_03214 [Kwoniella dejecticola CBS 10117]